MGPLLEVDIPLMHTRAPWSLIPVELSASIATYVVSEVAARTQTNQMRIVRRGADRDRFGCPALKVAQIMCHFFEIVGV